MYNFDDFKTVKIAESHIEQFTDELIEKLSGSELDTPVSEASLGDRLKTALSFKGPKLKKALKSYQKDLVDQALNDLDYEKRKEASDGKGDPKATERLQVAHKTKNDQLKARAQADVEKINDITNGNKAAEAVAKSGKIEARMAATQIAYKHADDQEKDALKLKLDKLSKEKQETLADINKYASSADDEAAAEQKKKEEEEKKKKEEEEAKEKERKEQEELAKLNKGKEGDPKNGETNSGNGSDNGSGKGKDEPKEPKKEGETEPKPKDETGEDKLAKKEKGSVAKQQIEKNKKQLEELKKDPEANKEKIEKLEAKIKQLEDAVKESEKYTVDEFNTIVESLINDMDQILNS